MDNRDTSEYISTLDDLLMNYVTTEEYTSLQLSERQAIVGCIREIRELISDLIAFSEKYCNPIQKNKKEEIEASNSSVRNC